MLSAIQLQTYYMAAAAAAAKPVDSHGGDHGGDVAFPPFDPTYFSTQIFWLLITFGILYFGLSRIFLPRIAQTLEDRSSRIADDLDGAARMQKQAEQAIKDYERALADAKAKAHNVAESTRQSIDAEIASELEAADADAAKQAEAADKRIRKIRSEALSNIDTIAAEVAQNAVEHITGKKVTLAAAKKAVGG